MEHECGAVMACAVSAAVGEAGKNRHYSFAPFGWPLSTYWADLRMAGMGVRRDKAALSSGCKPHPAIRSSRKQSEQSWR